MNTQGMTQIGKGVFSTVYKSGRNKVLIKSRDKVKECMAIGFFPNSKLFPVLTQVGISEDGAWQFYEEKFYPKVASIKQNVAPFEWEFYQVLRHIRSGPWGFEHLHKTFDTIPGKFWAKRQALKDAVDAIRNYSDDISFEISPRNVAVHKNRLVLLDCFLITTDLGYT